MVDKIFKRIEIFSFFLFWFIAVNIGNEASQNNTGERGDITITTEVTNEVATEATTEVSTVVETEVTEVSTDVPNRNVSRVTTQNESPVIENVAQGTQGIETEVRTSQETLPFASVTQTGTDRMPEGNTPDNETIAATRISEESIGVGKTNDSLSGSVAKKPRGRPKKNPTNYVPVEATRVNLNVQGEKADPNQKRRVTFSMMSSSTNFYRKPEWCEIMEERKRIRSDKDSFVSEYMVDVDTHQKQLHFFDVSPNLLTMRKLPNPSSVVPDKKRQSDDWCFCCIEKFNEGELVAVHSSCGKPHCVHIECFFEYFCGEHTRPSIEKGTDTLNLIPMCPTCQNRNGNWKTWNYSKRNISNWKTGELLAGINKDVVGIHQHKSDGHTFAHFITSINLFYSIKRELNIRTFRMEKPCTILLRETRRIFEQYKVATKETFICFKCNTEVVNWKQCYLNRCNEDCGYRICRDCFIDRVTTEYDYDTEYKTKGILQCTKCHRYGRGYFTSTGSFCVGLRKNSKNKKQK
jgi:hypothetical protein